jgi:hypothetical protein
LAEPWIANGAAAAVGAVAAVEAVGEADVANVNADFVEAEDEGADGAKLELKDGALEADAEALVP